MTSPQPLPQEGGAKSLYSKPFPLLSWEKGVRGMRPTDLGEGERSKFTRKKRKSYIVDPVWH